MNAVRPSIPPRSAFTLIEMAVVIFVLGIMAALLVPAVQFAREASRQTSCLSNLRQLGVALSTHYTAHGNYPSGVMPRTSPNRIALPTQGPLSIHYQILPYLDQLLVFNAINLSTGAAGGASYDPANSTARRFHVAVFTCPSDSKSLHPGCNYRGNLGADPFEFDGVPAAPGGSGAFPAFQYLRVSDFHDGLSQPRR